MAMTARDMQVRLREMLNGMVLKVQLEETAGGVGERVAALEAKLREQGDAMAAMQRDMADMRRAMVLFKGMAATGGLAEKSEGEGAGNGNTSGEAAEGSGTLPVKGARDNIFSAIEVEEVKAQVEAARGEARDTASEMRGEMAALKAELARMRAAAERQAAEVAYVKATAAHSEARINDVELALAAIKAGRVEKSRAEREAGSGEGQAAEERREGKRRKREEGAGEKGGVADVAAGAGCALIANGGAVVIKREEVERDGEALGLKNGAVCNTKAELQNLRARVKALEKTSASRSKTWEVSQFLSVLDLPAVRGCRQWSEAVPDMALMDLSGVSLLTDAALARVASFSSLTTLNLNDSSGFTEAGLKGLFSLTTLKCLTLQNTATTDGALEGISSLKDLRVLDLFHTKVTDAGVAKLQGMSALVELFLGDCTAVTNASMAHVGKLTALETLTLSDTAVTEDGLQRLSTLAALKLLVLPPGVTDSGMKHLRNLKRLEKLGVWDAKITAAAPCARPVSPPGQRTPALTDCTTQPAIRPLCPSVCGRIQVFNATTRTVLRHR
ncbi:unnamed protein product, partial [Closterium sp. Naga37s-1]